MKQLMFGCDPEIILCHATTGLPVSAIGKLPGTKDRPHMVKRGDGAVQVDNVLAEFNTRPANSSKMFNAVVHSVYEQMMELIQTQHHVNASRKSVDSFDETELQDKKARIVGCDPDWNAYTLQLNDPPNYNNHGLRSAGGHVHFGLDIDRNEVPYFVKLCDLIITVPMLIAEDNRRREFYGKAGSFRLKPYGVEYRTPSNHWVFDSETRVWMAERMTQVAKTFRESREIPDGLDTIINQHDLIKAEELLTAFSLERYPFNASIC